MSRAINRAAINSVANFDLGRIRQYIGFDPVPSFATEDQMLFAIDYAPEEAVSVLDEIGLVDSDGDGYRNLPSGRPLTLNIQFGTQGMPAIMVELIAQDWNAIGIRTTIKEVTSDEYRERANTNQADVLTWKFDGTAGSIIVLNTEMLLPPFGEPFNPGIAYLWAEWMSTDGASGIEPPADVMTLYELVPQFLQQQLGTAESDALGEQIVDIHVNNLWKIGIAGNVQAPIIRHNTLKNFGAYDVVSYDYYRSFPLIPAQWYFDE